MDMSMKSQDREEALRAARCARQLAICNLSTCESIDIEYGENKNDQEKSNRIPTERRVFRCVQSVAGGVFRKVDRETVRLE